MKLNYIFLVLIIFINGCGASTSSTTATNTPSITPDPVPTAINIGPPPPVKIEIQPGCVGKGPAAYGVSPLVIPVGTVVTWVNLDTLTHTVTEVSEKFDSNYIKSSQTWSYTFKTAGTFNYEDVRYGFTSMSGTIQVVDPQN